MQLFQVSLVYFLENNVKVQSLQKCLLLASEEPLVPKRINIYNTLHVPWLLQGSNKNLNTTKQKLLFKYKAKDTDAHFILWS